MNRTADVVLINSLEQIPTLETIKSIPRNRRLILVFDKGTEHQRETIGNHLKEELSDFQILIHTIKPEINIAKLITDKEIEDNQNFFEQCAKDYRKLGEELIFKLADKLKLDLQLNLQSPMQAFNEVKSDKRQMGKVEDWKYFVHGFHCGFENNKTGQVIEVPLVFGLEFGDLDPYFFMKFIKSTSQYHPLPVEIFEDYTEGVRVNKKMISLGKFEQISSNVDNHYGIVVTDRQKVEIKSNPGLKKSSTIENKQIGKAKFSFWEFMGLKSKK